MTREYASTPRWRVIAAFAVAACVIARSKTTKQSRNLARPTSRSVSSRGGGRDHLRQKLLALGLRAIAGHGRREALENAVLEGGDDGVVDIALAADRRRVGEFIGGGAHRFQHLATPTAGARRRRNSRQRFQHHGGGHQRAKILQRYLD